MMACDNENSVTPYYEQQFVHYYGINGNQYAKELLQLTDGFLLVGETSSPDSLQEIYMVKTDFFGIETWSTSFGTTFNDYYGGVTATSAGNFVISMTSDLDEKGLSKDLTLIEVSAAGTVQQKIQLPLLGSNEYSSDIIEISGLSTGYLITGSTEDSVTGESVLSNWRLDNNFVKVPLRDWITDYEWGTQAKGLSLFQENNSFYCLGYSNSTIDAPTTAKDFNPYIFKLTENGINETPVLLGTDNVDETLPSLTKRDNYLACAYLSSNTIIVDVVTLSGVKTSAYTVPSTKNITFSDVQFADEGFYIMGTDVLTVDDHNIYICKFSGSEIIWEREFGAADIDTGAKGMYVQPDGGIVFLGTVEFGHQSKFALIKLNKDGDLNP